jgi:hypothetical protein
MGGDLFDDFGGFRFGVAVGGGFGEVEAGDLEAVEEQAGAAGVDVVGGDALEDFADGLLDGGTVFRQRKVEGGAAASALLRVGDGFSGGVVVVAELFSAQAGAAATMAIGEDVAALVLFDGWCCVFHGGSLSREKCAKSSKEKTCVRTSRCAGLA